MNALLLPRGIRNNNPGNIRLSKTRWQGQRSVQSDPDFVEFTESLFGLRALMRVLVTYYMKYDLNTVESLINRWAPPHENATDHYIHHVARMMNVRRRDILDVASKQVLVSLARAIALHENGKPAEGYPLAWYDNALYDRAADLALYVFNPPVKGERP